MISVWIVHDTLHMLLLLRNAVTMHGHRDVSCFTSCGEVLARVRQGQKPDVIIVEDSLAGMSGSELLAMLDNMCGIRKGILLVPPRAHRLASQHHAVLEGLAGFHESLEEAIHLTTQESSEAFAAQQTATASDGCDQMLRQAA